MSMNLFMFSLSRKMSQFCIFEHIVDPLLLHLVKCKLKKFALDEIEASNLIEEFYWILV